MDSVNWNAYYGVGKGNSNIIQGNPALDDLKQTYALRQQQKAAENAAFTSQIAKLNFGGAKDADLDYLHKQYGDVINTFGQLRNTNDPAQRAKLSLQLQQQQNGFAFDVEKSKEANKQDMDLAHLPLNPNANLADGATDKILGLTKMSTFDPKRQGAYQDVTNNLFDKPYDLGGETQKIAKGLTYDRSGDDKWVNVPGIGLVNQKTKGKQLDQSDYMNALFSRAKTDPKFGHALMKETGTNDITQAIGAYGQQTYPTYSKGLGEQTTFGAHVETNGQKEALHQSNRLFDAAHPVQNGQQVNVTLPAPQDVSVSFKGNNPNGTPVTSNFKNYRAVSIPKATVIPTSGINDEGKPTKVAAGEYRVIGYADMPVMKSTGEMAQPGYEKQHPEDVVTKPIAHIQVDHKGRTKNYYIDPNSVNVNNTGQKNQTKAVQQVKQDRLGIFN